MLCRHGRDRARCACFNPSPVVLRDDAQPPIQPTRHIGIPKTISRYKRNVEGNVVLKLTSQGKIDTFICQDCYARAKRGEPAMPKHEACAARMRKRATKTA